MAKAAKKQTRINETDDYDPYSARNGNIDNVVPLKNEALQEDAVKAVNIAKYKRAADDLASENGRFRNVVKHVEAKGINTKALKRAIAIQKSGKTEEIVSELTALFEYLMILGTPIDKKQLDLFRVEAPRTPSVEKAKEHGRYNGIMGLGMDQNPYSIDSEQGQAWMDAWHAGGKERELVLAMEPAAAELIKGDDEEGFDEHDEDGEADVEDPFDAADPANLQAE